MTKKKVSKIVISTNVTHILHIDIILKSLHNYTNNMKIKYMYTFKELEMIAKL